MSYLFTRLSKKASMPFILVSLLLSLPSFSGVTEQAKKMHDRLIGVPPSPTVLSQMSQLIQNSQTTQAALLAMDSPFFYNNMLKNWIGPWTNVPESPHVTLNDFTATAIGMIRDDVPFDQILYGDFIYVGNDALVEAKTIAAYSPENNNHYRDMESRFIGLKENLVRKNHTSLNEVTDNAGVITTRAFAESYFQAGTNRRATRFLFKVFACYDFEDLKDTTRPDFRVRRDVDRQPGGDARTYRNRCAGCHAGQDGFGGAWAYFDWNGKRITHTPGVVVSKMNHNVLFTQGHVTTDNSWINLWDEGKNAHLEWQGPKTGNGANSLGKMFSKSGGFSRCMAKKVYDRVCLKNFSTIVSNEEQQNINDLAEEFQRDNNYNMKNLFAKAIGLCLDN
jgi:hypothetical protein